MIRGLKIGIALTVAFWGLVGLIFNLTSLDITYQYIESVASMGWAPEDAPRPPWVSASPVLIWLGVALVILGKFLPFLGGGVGAFAMIRQAGGSAEAFHHAKRWAILGAGGGFLLLFLGFAIFGEMVFAMYLDGDLEKAAQAAWRYGGFMGLSALIIGQPD